MLARAYAWYLVLWYSGVVLHVVLPPNVFVASNTPVAAHTPPLELSEDKTYVLFDPLTRHDATLSPPPCYRKASYHLILHHPLCFAIHKTEGMKQQPLRRSHIEYSFLRPLKVHTCQGFHTYCTTVAHTERPSESEPVRVR